MAIIYNKNRKKGLFYIPSGGLGPSVSADFAYSKSSYNQGEADPTPTITGTAGGTFNASANVVFVDTGTFNSSTGQIDLSATTIDSHIITYTVDGVQSGQTVGVTAVPYASTSSFTFDGVDSYFDAGLIDITSSKTISIWFKSSNISSIQGLFEIMPDPNTSDFLVVWIYNSKILVSSNGVVSDSKESSVLSSNTWYNLIITKSSGIIDNIYINGLDDTQSTTDTLGFVGGRGNTYIGATYQGTAYAYEFNGNLDEVSIWNTALSQSAVTEIYNSGAPNDLTTLTNASNTNLKAWYKF